MFEIHPNTRNQKMQNDAPKIKDMVTRVTINKFNNNTKSSNKETKSEIHNIIDIEG